MNEAKGINMLGCTVGSLWGFPVDSGGVWGEKEFVALKEALAAQRFSGRLAVLSSYQLEAKQILEDNGFVVLGRIISSHYNQEETAIKKWIAAGANDKTTVYLLGKGFYTGEIQCKPMKSKAVVASKLSRVLNVLDKKMRSAAKRVKT